MKINQTIKRLWLSCAVLCAFLIQPYAQVTIENRHFRYEVESNGQNRCFTDKATGEEHLFPDTVSHCAYIIREGKRYNANRVSQEGENVRIRFGESGVTASLRLRTLEDYVSIKLVEVTGKPESIAFLNIPLNLEGLFDEPFAACALAMNLQTHVEQLPALQDHLWAAAYERFGTIGSEVSLIGVPRQEILPVIRNIMQQAKEIPFSDQGGAWASLGKEGYGSYLMNFGALTEETVDEWIGLCKQLGFNQIDNHGGGRFFTFGELELNREKWPDGWASFKRINQKLHKAGISSILHTYAFFVDKNCKYVTPVPSKELGHYRTFTLKEPIGAEDTVIVVNESTAGISTIIGFMEQNSVSLRVGKEIIVFEGVSKVSPYGFTGCKRGALGTKAAAHATTDTLYHLREHYGRFMPDPNSSLFSEIARKTAEIVNECGFDGIYFDAIDGCTGLANREESWYHGTKFVLETARHLEKPVGMEMSAMYHHWWHYRSRWQAWDAPNRGYKAYFDIHADAVKGGSPARYYNPNDAEKVNRRSLFDKGRLQLPLHFGWFSLETGVPPQVEPTLSDDIEYLCCKMLGNNAGLSILCSDDVREKMKNNPTFKRLADIIRQYETLRHQGYFDDNVRKQLREPGKEFTLVKEGRKWNLKPTVYSKQLVSGRDESTVRWTVENTFSEQPLRARIELLMSAKSYDDPGNIVLTDFPDGAAFTDRERAEGVATAIAPAKATDRFDGTAAELSACNLGIAPKWGSWTKIGRSFTPELDLTNHQALGVWVKGDGKGELLNVRLQTPPHISFGARGDHLIPIDFTGWKYFELIGDDGAEAYRYDWDSHEGKSYYPYFRERLHFNHINGLQFNFNLLPEGEVVRCLIAPVKALSLVTNTIKNPAITVGDNTITFPVTMESGMYLELDEKGRYVVYNVNGEEVAKGKLKGAIPTMRAEANEVVFSFEETEKTRCRARVTIATVGEALVKR